MKYRRFGTSGDEVSILGFGCMRLPILDEDRTRINDELAIPMLRHAIDAGVNYVDTAYPYHSNSMEEPGASEPFVGRALQDGYRQKVKIATKLPPWLVESRDDMERILDQQLERLQTQQIDCYLLHALNRLFWPKLEALGVLDFLNAAQADGRIKRVGFSFHDSTDLFRSIVDAHDWDFCQIQYNYLDEQFQAGAAGLDHAVKKGLGIVVMEPLRGGHLCGPLPQEAEQVFAEARTSRSHAEWALRWVWNNPGVTTLLSGMTELWQLDENLKIADRAEAGSLSSDDLQRIEQVKQIYQTRQKVPCTQCSYCMPCPSGVDIPANLAAYNNYYLFDTDSSRFMAKMFYATTISDAGKADRCVACGKCLEHCPQQIAIPEALAEIDALFSQKK